MHIATMTSCAFRSVLMVAILGACHPLVCTAIASDDILDLPTSDRLADLQGLVNRFDEERLLYFHIIPPDESFRLCQPIGTLVFDPTGFQKEFLAGLEASTEYDCPVYRIVISEDPATRETLFANVGGKQFYASSPDKEYDARWVLASLYPATYAGQIDKETLAWLETCYDPSCISIMVTLLPSDYADKYFAAQTAEAQEQAARIKPNGGMLLRGYSGPAVTNLVFTAMGKQTNGMCVTLAYPGDFTNRVDFFTTADLVPFWWEAALTTNINTATNWIEWVDATYTNAPLRFYTAGNADLDSTTDEDGDGLTWAREHFMYHTSPTNSDTDADGWGDYDEVINRHTDPNNPDTNAPTAWIIFPANSMERTWTP